MATPIHHAILKRAARLGIRVVDNAEGTFQIAKGNALSENTFATAKEAVDEYAREPKGFVWAVTKAGYCGVMVASYHDRYEHNTHGPGSCDGLDCALRDAYTSEETGIDRDGLVALGEELGLYNAAWNAVNNGMVRMNLSNRIRAWLRNDPDAKLTIGGVTGRFGVPYRPSKKAARLAARKAA
jgi:hypothetical protein